ncbi:translation initiation factor 2 [Rhodoligotrophos ferricapiens]|uniref:translation initiation factor 2 n=1 Tax=Rhodoligotrophos ferricapiens TaxID=3069264 RepID=UPI00315C9A14
MRILFLGAFVALGSLLGGCASIVNGTSQSIAISSPPVSGAQCDLSSAQGRWTVITPGVATVARSKDDIRVECHAPGYETAVAVIPSSFEAWTAGNLVFGGVIGLGVDAATGAINEYPNSFQIPMVPKGQAPALSPGRSGPPVS